jgi:cob(I)alamin adenosyltransferase
MPIYTRTGDKGETGIIGKRLLKNSTLIDLIGSIDELNASIGLAQSFSKEKTELEDIQSTLFAIGAILANGKVKIGIVGKVKSLESEIDKMDLELKPLKNFILPGGTIVASHLHLSRTICRRAERILVNYINSENETSDKLYDVLKYINRLSDYLFTLARFLNQKEGIEELNWNIN